MGGYGRYPYMDASELPHDPYATASHRYPPRRYIYKGFTKFVYLQGFYAEEAVLEAGTEALAGAETKRADVHLDVKGCTAVVNL